VYRFLGLESKNFTLVWSKSYDLTLCFFVTFQAYIAQKCWNPKLVLTIKDETKLQAKQEEISS
jgi:hypothetical protein